MARPSAGSRTTPVPEEAEALRHLASADPLLAILIAVQNHWLAHDLRRGRYERAGFNFAPMED